MFRIRPAQNSHTTVEALPAEPEVVTQAPQAHVWGTGTVLQQPQPVEAHQITRSEEVTAIVQMLLTTMEGATLPAANRRAFARWAIEWAGLAENDLGRDNPILNEQRAVALGILVIRAFRAGIERASPEEQGQRLMWEDLCRQAIQTLLPEEPTEEFLDQCEEGLAEEQRLLERQRRVNVAAEILVAGLSEADETVQAMQGEHRTLLYQRLRELQEVRRTLSREAHSQLLTLAEEVDRVGRQIEVVNQEIETVDDKNEENRVRFQNLLHECESLLTNNL